MGNSSYSVKERSIRSTALNYETAPLEKTFTQQAERKAHDLMLPKGVRLRECRDSAAHPNATPILFYLDVTGSMMKIPHQMIKNGLPTLMSTLIQGGVPDAALMFGAIGDHVSDRYPLQIAQFESGDAELDMWLTRTYLEGNGGSNEGESYPLAWYFTSRFVKTDAFEKRGQKSFLFTCGDEPFLKSVPVTALKQLMGDDIDEQGGVISAEQLLSDAQKTSNVFHIFIEHGRRKVDEAWREALGQNLIVVDDYSLIPKLIAETVMNALDTGGMTRPTPPAPTGGGTEVKPYL